LDEIELPYGSANDWEQLHPFHKRSLKRMGVNGDPLDPQMIRQVRATYFAMITFLDHQIGRILKLLDESGMWEDTVVIYTADHGEMLGEHLRWNKMCFYEQSVRIPMIISRPKDRSNGNIGRRIEENVSLVDLGVTIPELAGAEVPEDLKSDGRPLISLLDEKDRAWDNVVFSELYHEYNMHGPTAMLKRDQYKYNFYHQESPELFDLSRDQGEICNLAGKPEYSELQSAMENELLSRWNPEALDGSIRESQKKRRFLSPYLFSYIEKERKSIDSRFTGDLN
ncbi:MAG: sulfatase-like hydrolase/transferase, partial [Spirochaetales bacterium]|nr:sulfatase-like hydrolase/transferase [Spirochaetales bacterium]